ncbi:hypothetical protein KC867_00040 [Candidatus Saccharibacteria bacterium]|nr:hypothetical protein [Candidatus Saccharibacteria bacterium]
MSNVMVAFLFSLGASAWIYTKMMKSNGGQTKSALTVAGVVAFILFLFLLTVLDKLTN